MSDEKVCVVGATGYLGISVVEELCRRNSSNKSSSHLKVVAVARNASSPNVSRLRELGVTLVFVDATSHDDEDEDEHGNSYDRLFRREALGTTTAISCLAARTATMTTATAEEGDDVWTVDRDANIRFGRAAFGAGVKHLLLVSTFEGRESRSVSEFSAAKEDAVDVLLNECHNTTLAADIQLTVVRPNAYFKDLTNRAFDAVLTHARHTVLGHGTHLINPIAREDVAIFIADCVQGKQQHERGKDYPMGGPDIFTFREIGMLAAKVIHRHNNMSSSSSPTMRGPCDITIREIPLWKLRLMATLLQGLHHLLVLVGCCRQYARGARRRAAVLHWMLYVSTHDAVAPCYGSRRLEDEYERKCQTLLDLKSND